MSSQITPQSINQNFPVAGVDNNSQGFRDNFTNIKNNFIVTAREINDLLDKVVVKAPLLYGSTPNVANNNFGNTVVSNMIMSNFGLAIDNLGEQTDSGNITLDVSLGPIKTLELANSSAITTVVDLLGWRSSQYTSFKLTVDVTDAGHTLSFGSESLDLTEHIANFNHTNNEISFPTVGQYNLEFSSIDGGNTVILKDLDHKPLLSKLSSNLVIDDANLVSTGLSFSTKANVMYAFNAVIPFEHDDSSTSEFSFSIEFGNVSATGMYTVEQQPDESSPFEVNTHTVSNQYSNVETGSTEVRMAKINGTFSHTLNSNVTVTASTDAGNLTILQGAYLKAYPLS